MQLVKAEPKTESMPLATLAMLKAKNSPGFIVNRILCPMINEAIFALQEGLGNAETL